MKFAEYWARERHEETDAEGRVRWFVCVGWSHHSLQEARDDAIRRARRVVRALIAGESLGPRGGDYYGGPMREEVLDSIVVDGETVGIISRNRYGALVLNCDRVMFVDVDFPEVVQQPGFLARLFGLGRRKREPAEEAPMRETLERIETWAGEHSDRSFRLYRTRMGLRLLFTDRLYEPASAEADATLRELGADPLYVKLTEKQECFRARLTSKPWRCESHRPPGPFPRLTDEEIAAHRSWEARYAAADARYSVCDFIGEFGRRVADPLIDRIVALHDEKTRAFSDSELA